MDDQRAHADGNKHVRRASGDARRGFVRVHADLDFGLAIADQKAVDQIPHSDPESFAGHSGDGDPDRNRRTALSPIHTNSAD